MRAKSRMKILVIDDNQDGTFMFKMLLKTTLKADVEIAYNGRSGIEKVGTFKPEYVVLDITLPDMSGEEVAQIIKEKYPEIKIIGMSGYGEEDLNINKKHFLEFWEKPVSVEMIKRKFNETNS